MEEITQNLVSFVSISKLKEKTVTCGKSYKFSLLNQSKIISLWEIGHKFVLKNPNQVRPMDLERSFRVLRQGQISDIEDPKS